jgi:hypothetical protein
MTKSLTRECRLIAFGYICFGLMYIPIIIAMLYMSMSYGLSAVDFFKSISGILGYLLIMSSINLIMAISVWRIFSLSKKMQRAIVGAAVLIAILAIIIFIGTIVMWLINSIPDWYNPLYKILQITVLTFGYSYNACALRKMMRFYNDARETANSQ